MKIYPDHLRRFLPNLHWSAEELATNLSMIGHEAEIEGEALEVKVFPNRGDALSLRGLTRDLAALYPVLGAWNDVETAKLPEPITFYPLTVSEAAESVVWSDHLLMIENYEPTSTPVELAQLLKPLNLQSKDLLIDLTNIVAYEMGQPLHAFDLKKVENGMTIDFAREGEELTTLNKKVLRLNNQMLIARTNEGTPTDLLGTMGGDNSAVTTSTQTILLQAAALDGAVIRANSRASGIKTEASYRYERGVDPQLAEQALGRFVFYLQKYAPNVRVSNYQRLLNLPTTKKVAVQPQQISRLLGAEISQKNLTDLTRLGFVIEDDEVVVPSWRFDIDNWADVAEEVARLIGLNNIKPQPLTKVKAVPAGPYAQVLALKHQLVDAGYTETMTYSFASDGPVTLQNPRTKDQRALRASLQTGLILTLARNPFLPQAAFFEIGNVFLPEETNFLGIIVSGVKAKHKEPTEAALTQLLHTPVTLSAVDQSVLDQYDVKQKNVYWWEGALNDIKLPATYSYQHQALATYRPISKFPPIVRDTTLLVDQSVNPKDITAIARENPSVLLAELIDSYEAETLGEGKVALTFRLFFQKLDGSLTDEEGNKLLDQIFQQLRDKVEFEVR